MGGAIRKKQQKDPTKPAGPNNPWDPKKESVVSLFTCYDGQLEIREYRNDSTKRATLTWVKLDPRHQQHIYYHDPMAPIYEKKDPYDHAIALAAYSAAEGHSGMGSYDQCGADGGSVGGGKIGALRNDGRDRCA